MKLPVRPLLVAALMLSASFTGPAHAQGLDPIKTFDLVASRFVADPARHQIYASITGNNSVAVIDTNTLAVTETLAVGSAPVGMSMSPDGAKLYVALSGSTSIGVVDLINLTVGTSLPITQKPYQVVAGLDDRLYVSPATTSGKLLQVDATTGVTQGTVDFNPYLILLQISPDRTMLYAADTGNSGSTLKRYDVSSTTSTLLQVAADTGANGEDLKLSHNGELLCYPNGAGNSTTYNTDVLNPADLDVIYGTFVVGPYPGPLAFSEDDSVAYEANFGSDSSVRFFSTSSFLQFASFLLPLTNSGTVFDLIADSSGRYLLVADDEAIRVYDLAVDTSASETATVGAPFSFQTPLYINGTTIDATGLPAGLAFDPVTHTISGTPTEDGVFPIVVTASDGTNTVTASLSLTLYPNSRAQNISTRVDVQGGDDVLIAGFIVTGSEATHQTKQVILRALGPSLMANGQSIAGRLGDPMLELHDSTGALIDSNDDWEDNPQSADILQGYGLSPSDPAEAGLFEILSPGAYTVIVRGAHSSTGIGLVEVYDIDAQDVTTAMGAARLANISTRGKVETGDNVMIGGFIVSGDDDAHMLVRAIGPSLSMAGVAEPLADPQLDLYDAQGTKIGSDDNWKDTQEAEIIATGLAPTIDSESAISASLAPGAYTAIVSGVGETTGIGLVEAYNLP